MFIECSYRRVEAIGFSKNTPKMIYLSPCQTGLFDAKVLGNLNRCIYFIFWYFWRLMRQALLVNPKILKFEEKLYQIMISKLWHHKCMKKMQMLSNTSFFWQIILIFDVLSWYSNLGLHFEWFQVIADLVCFSSKWKLKHEWAESWNRFQLKRF